MHMRTMLRTTSAVEPLLSHAALDACAALVYSELGSGTVGAKRSLSPGGGIASNSSSLLVPANCTTRRRTPSPAAAPALALHALPIAASNTSKGQSPHPENSSETSLGDLGKSVSWSLKPRQTACREARGARCATHLKVLAPHYLAFRQGGQDQHATCDVFAQACVTIIALNRC